MKKILFILPILILISCENQIKAIKNFQWDSLFGPIWKEARQQNKKNNEIQKWEKSIKKYEKQMNKKISAAKYASLLYRRIGMSYGKIEAFPLCIENLEKAISLGYVEDDIFYELGICQANLASQKNWDSNLTQKAESTFLALLNKYPHYKKAYYPLSLIYFYGISGSSYKIIYGEKVYSKTSFFQKKGIEMMQRYQRAFPEDEETYFALAHMFMELGRRRKCKKIHKSINPTS